MNNISFNPMQTVNLASLLANYKTAHATCGQNYCVDNKQNNNFSCLQVSLLDIQYSTIIATRIQRCTHLRLS